MIILSKYEPHYPNLHDRSCSLCRGVLGFPCLWWRRDDAGHTFICGACSELIPAGAAFAADVIQIVAIRRLKRWGYSVTRVPREGNVVRLATSGSG